MFLAAVENGDTKTALEMVKQSARGANIWQDPRGADICEEVFPADTWGEGFLMELSAHLDGSNSL